MSEVFVREVLARQYGCKPEEVTQEQIRFEVSGLLPHYSGIHVPLMPKESVDAVEKQEAAISQQPQEQQPHKYDSVAAERSALLDAYKREGKEQGIRITDEMVAKAAWSKWNERTAFQRWKRNDPRCTAGDDAKIRSVLRKKPHLSR